MFLPYIKLFFLPGKKTFYQAYLAYIVHIDFFDNSSLCFLFLFLSMLLQSCKIFSKYLAVSDFTKDILNQTFKIQRKSRTVLMLYSMYPFYKNYTAF